MHVSREVTAIARAATPVYPNYFTGYTVTRGVSAMHQPGCWPWGGRKTCTVRKFTFFALKTGNFLRTFIARKSGMFRSSLDDIRMVEYCVVLSNTSTPSGRSD